MTIDLKEWEKDQKYQTIISLKEAMSYLSKSYKALEAASRTIDDRSKLSNSYQAAHDYLNILRQAKKLYE